MFRVKGTVVFFILLLFLVIFSGCSKEPNQRSGNTNDQDQVELVFLTGNPENEVMRKVIEEDVVGAFEKSNPNIKIKMVENEDPSTLVRQQLAAGAGPDIVRVNGPTLITQLAQADYLLPLDDYAKEFGWGERYFDWAYETGFYDGNLYGLPGPYESIVIWYNKDLFEEKGWEEPTNLQEFMDLNEEIMKEDIIPLAFGTTDFRAANEWLLSSAYNSYLGPDELEKVLKNEVPWTNELVNEATTILKDMWQTGYINEKQSHAISQDDAWGLFRTQRTAMKLEGTWALSTFATEPLDFEVDFFTVPGWRDEVEPILPMALGDAIGINAATKYPDEAAKFIDWLFGDEVANIMFEHGVFYSNEGIETSSNVDKIVSDVHKELEAAFEKGNNGYASWTYWGPNVEYYLWDNLDSVFLDQLSVEKYLENAQKNAVKDQEEGLLFNFND